ncbi:MAG TPA: hypothetical protein PK308_00225 [Phycisphaerales bacterium]|nr:hypothetical protein [Phycisphaerales bacterium]
MSPIQTRPVVRRDEPAFLEGGRLQPIRSFGELAAIRCPRCDSAEILLDWARIRIRPGRPHEATIDGALRCPTPCCGWYVRIERGLAIEIETEAWLTDPLKSRSGRPIVFPPRVDRAETAQGFGK